MQYKILAIIGLIAAVGLYMAGHAYLNDFQANKSPYGDKPKNVYKQGDYEFEDGVLILTDANFDAFMATQKYSLIKFYAPWCGHCKHLAPEFARAAQILSNSTEKIQLTQVDATAEKQLSERFGIQGFPTLYYYINGFYVPYDGGRTAQEIANWVKNRTVERAEQANEAKIAQVKSKKELTVVLYTQDVNNDTDQQLKAFKTLSIMHDEIAFLYSNVNKEYSKNQVVFYRKFFDKPALMNNQTFELSDLEAFISKNQLPNPLPFSRKSVKNVFEPKLPVILLITNNSVEAEGIYQKVVNKMSGSANVTFSSTYRGGVEFIPKLIEHFGLNETKLPAVVCFGGSDNEKKYVMTDPLTYQNIVKFVEDIVAGKAQTFKKSQPIPDNTGNIVKKIVGLSFEKEVLQSKKDILLKIFAPWCHHCQEFAPIYEKLATDLQNNTNLMFAEMDYTANEVDQIKIESYPTIFFFKSNDKENPIKFTGERQPEVLIEFLKNNTQFQWVE